VLRGILQACLSPQIELLYQEQFATSQNYGNSTTAWWRGAVSIDNLVSFNSQRLIIG